MENISNIQNQLVKVATNSTLDSISKFTSSIDALFAEIVIEKQHLSSAELKAYLKNLLENRI